MEVGFVDHKSVSLRASEVMNCNILSIYNVPGPSEQETFQRPRWDRLFRAEGEAGGGQQEGKYAFSHGRALV